MQQLTIRHIKKFLNDLPDDYLLYTKCECFVDPVEEVKVEHHNKAIIFK